MATVIWSDEMGALPYSQWLTEGLQALAQIKVSGIVLAALAEDGQVLTGYYNCSVGDKAVLAANIQSDATLDVIHANIDTIAGWLAENEAGDSGDDDANNDR